MLILISKCVQHRTTKTLTTTSSFQRQDNRITLTARLRHCCQCCFPNVHNGFLFLFNLCISIVYGMKEAWLPQGQSQCRRSKISMLHSCQNTRWQARLQRTVGVNGILEAFRGYSKFRTMSWSSLEYRFHRFHWFLILSNELRGSDFLPPWYLRIVVRDSEHIHIGFTSSNISPLPHHTARKHARAFAHAHSVIYSLKQLVRKDSSDCLPSVTQLLGAPMLYLCVCVCGHV